MGWVQDNSVEIYAFSKDDPEKKISMLRVNILHDDRQIHIPNIIVPPMLEHQGLGKKLIRLIFEIGAHYGYYTFVVDLVEGFRNRLLARGALETNIYDVLQITKSTRLM